MIKFFKRLLGANPRYIFKRLAQGVRDPKSLTRGPQPADDMDPAVKRDLDKCRPYTMVSTERLLATSDAVEYVVRKGIPGALVECGVWRGGNVLAMIFALQRLGVNDREIWLYDTFEGMTEPTEFDVSEYHKPAAKIWAEAAAAGKRAWDSAFSAESFGLEQVQSVLRDTGYPEHLIHYVVGPVEETMPGELPKDIAVLRLDTDWYESTHHEMVHLYPLVTQGGVLLIDDYGHWQGARKAIDEYLTDNDETLLLHRTDYSGRVALKA